MITSFRSSSELDQKSILQPSAKVKGLLERLKASHERVTKLKSERWGFDFQQNASSALSENPYTPPIENIEVGPTEARSLKINKDERK